MEKKQVLEISYAKVGATGKPLSVLPFGFYSHLQTKPFLRTSLEQLISQKAD